MSGFCLLLMNFKSVFLQSYKLEAIVFPFSMMFFVMIDDQTYHFIVTLETTFLTIGLEITVISFIKNNFKGIVVLFPKIVDFSEIFEDARTQFFYFFICFVGIQALEFGEEIFKSKAISGKLNVRIIGMNGGEIGNEIGFFFGGVAQLMGHFVQGCGDQT